MMQLPEARHAFRLGRGLARSKAARPSQAVPQFIATLCLGLALIIASLALASYRGTESRGAAIAPVVASTSEHAIGYVKLMVAEDPLTIFAVQPLDVRSAPPPGLSTWPLPGEAWVSPAVAVSYPVGSSSPYGKIAGLIDPKRLSSLDEHWVYFNPSNTSLKTLARLHPDSYIALTGFGSPDSSSYSSIYMESLAVFEGMVAMFLIVPALALVWSSTGVNLARRRKAIESYSILGASGQFKVLLLIGECLGPVSIGVVSLAALPVALTYVDLPLPLTGATLLRQDSLAALPTSLGAIVIAAALVITIFTHRATSIRQRSNTNGARSRSVPMWLAWLAPLSLIALAQGWYGLVPGLELQQVAAFSLLLTLLATTPVLLWGALKALASYRAHHTSSLALLIGLRQLLAKPSQAITATFAILFAVSIFGTTQLYTTFYSSEGAMAHAVGDKVGSSVVTVNFAFKDSRPSIADIAHSQPNLAFVALSASNNVETGTSKYTVRGDCTAIAALQLPCPVDSAPVAVNQVTNPALGYFVGTSSLEVQKVSPQSTYMGTDDFNQFLLVNTQGRSIDMGPLQNAANSHLAQARTISAAWSNDLDIQHMKWLTLFAPATMILLSLALSLNAWASILVRVAAVSHLVVLWRESKMIWAVTTAVLLVPLLLGLAGGLIVYQALGVIFGATYKGMHVDGSTFMAIATSTLICLIAYWALATRMLSETIKNNPLGVIS